MLKTLFAAAAISLASLGMASAATVTSTNPDLAALAPTSITLPGGATFSSLPGSPVTVSGSLGGQYRSPFEGLGAGNFGDIKYFNVTANNTATLDLASTRTSFSFLWGSVDAYNTLRLVNTITNAVLDVVSTNLGNPDAITVGSGASYVTVSGFTFNQVQFISTGNSFEFSNVAAVPLPAGGLLLIGALGGLAALRRRKARAA